MARNDATIRVAILGDVKELSKALGTAERDVKGFGVSANKIIGGIGFGIAAGAAVDFAQTALGEADRVGDAMTRLELQIGKDLAGALSDTAEGFHKIGLSRQDVLKLAAGFADLLLRSGRVHRSSRNGPMMLRPSPLLSSS